MRRRDDLVGGPREKAIAAVRAGDTEAAIEHIEALHLESKPIHDRFNEWHQSLLNFIADKLGEEAVGEAMERIYDDVYKEGLSAIANLPHEAIVQFLASGWRAHFSDFVVEEDDEKTVLDISYCGSGGRLQSLPEPFGRRTQKPYPWSYDQAGVNYFCIHEAVFNQKFKEMGLNFLEFQYGEQFGKDRQKTGCGCKVIIYKDKNRSEEKTK